MIPKFTTSLLDPTTNALALSESFRARDPGLLGAEHVVVALAAELFIFFSDPFRPPASDHVLYNVQNPCFT